MEETLIRIANSLEFIGVILFFILIIQTITLFFKDNNGGFYLRQINETLKNIINNHIKE
jgi:uncharacterized membrane protein